MADKIFPKGLWVNKPHEKAPPYIIANITIDMNQLNEFARNHADTEGKIRLVVKHSENTGNYYPELDTYRRDNSQQQPQRQQPAPMPTFQAPAQQPAQQPQQGQDLQEQIPF
jgi:hypothetical protein